VPKLVFLSRLRELENENNGYKPQVEKGIQYVNALASDPAF